MCELLGMSFNKPVKCGFSFRGLTGRSIDNPDGWGIALYPEGGKAVQVIKEPLKAESSKLAEFVKNYDFYSNIFLSHIRKASSGSESYANTHPFIRELNGREYAFAHNGTLSPDCREKLSTGRWKPVGDTDTEFSFCYLLNMMETIQPMWNDKSFVNLENIMKEINQYGKFNCLLTDGEYLFCYCDKDNRGGLRYTERKPPYNNIKLKDNDIEVSLGEIKGPNEVGTIVATNPLTKEFWPRICQGTLTVFCAGKQVFSACKNSLEEKILHALYTIRTSLCCVSVSVIADTIEVESSEVHRMLKPLIDEGLIRQDRRDSSEPFDSCSTYYTIKPKRDEIDRLLWGDISRK